MAEEKPKQTNSIIGEESPSVDVGKATGEAPDKQEAIVDDKLKCDSSDSEDSSQQKRLKTTTFICSSHFLCFWELRGRWQLPVWHQTMVVMFVPLACPRVLTQSNSGLKKTSSLEKRWLEVELDESVKLLDLCCTLKDSLIMKNEHIKDLKLALRRKDGVAMKNKAIAFIRAEKKIDKEMRNCFRSIKDTKDKCIDKDNNLETVSKFFMEVKAITTSLLQLVLSCLSTQSKRQRSSRWSVIAQALGKRKMAGEGENQGNGFEGLGIFESFESILHKPIDDEMMQKVHNQLQSTEILMEGLENGMEGLFRQMIHSRVTLLNILGS